MGSADRFLDLYNRKNNRYFKLAAGEKKIARFMPPYDPSYALKAKKLGAMMDSKIGMCGCRQHGFLPRLPLEANRQGGGFFVTNWRCLADMKKPCPLCAFFDGLPEADKEIRFRHGARPQAWIDLYVKESGSVLRWFLNKTTVERVQDIFNTVPTINDPAKGRNLEIHRTGTGFETKYSIKVLEKRMPLPPKAEWPRDILEELDNMPIIKGPVSTKKVVKAAFPDLLS